MLLDQKTEAPGVPESASVKLQSSLVCSGNLANVLQLQFIFQAAGGSKNI